jgi:hypothetical protein
MWLSCWTHLPTMLREMDKQKLQTKASSSWSNVRSRRTRNDGIQSSMKHYGHIGWLAMDQPKYHRIN